MGGYVSTPARAAKAKSDLIDKQIEGDSEQSKRECKVLLLGTDECGKSTIVKQIKLIHQNGFSDAELAGYRPVVYNNIIDSAQAVVSYMRNVGLECIQNSNRILTEKILDYKLDAALRSSASCSKPYFSPEIADAIYQVWKDPIIPKMMEEHFGDFYSMESASYFFTEVLRIGTPGYLPSETDVLRAKQKSLGITETQFTTGALSIRLFDIGCQRSERKKWIHCFENVNSIIFCTALSEYDQVLPEEKPQRRPHLLSTTTTYSLFIIQQIRMAESLVLFESIVNSRWFLRTSIILLLNKIDIFKAKLPKVPLEQYFPEYVGGADINKATRYILWKFMQANRARLNVYPHLMQATDTSNIRLIFTVVKETILRNALTDSGIL